MGYMGISLWSVSKFVAVAAFVLVMGVILTQEPAFAISTGNLTGRVTTDAGAPIAGASVSAVAPTGRYTAKTDAHGFYSIVNMQPDTYTVTISAEGYDPTSILGVTIFQDQS